VEINEHFEATISTHGVVEVTIEAVVADIFKTFTGMLVEALLGQVVDSTLETSRRNTLLPHSLTRHNQGLTRALPSTMAGMRMKRITKTYSDHRKNCKLRIRKQPRRRKRSRCHHQADHPQLGHKASRTRQSSALPSKDHLRLLRPHQSRKFLQN
jgi:hypothetical protein